MPGVFARDSAVERIAAGDYRAAIAANWDIGGSRSNGGYMLAIAARAMALESGRPDPVSITGHFLNPGTPGPARVSVELLKSGKRFAQSSATLRAGDRPLVLAVAAFGDLSQAEPGLHRVDAAPPDLPAPDHCVPHGAGPDAPPFFSNLDLRLHPDDAGFLHGNPSGELRVRGWFRFAADEPVDTLGLLIAVDSFPPTAFNAPLPVNWTPTVELTTHVRARPAPGWLRANFSTRFVTGGFLEEDGEIWDATGRLVAQSRQLALLPRG